MTSYAHSIERGHAARLDGRFAAASRHYAAALTVAASPRDAADAMAGLGMAERGLCRYARAIAILNRALTVYQRLRDKDGRAFALYARGGARRFLGDFRGAAKDLETALALAPDVESEIFTRMAIGGLLRMTGRFEESLEAYRRARVLAGRRRLPYAMAYADCGIGNAFRLLGDRRRARAHLERADARYRTIGDRVSRPYTLFALLMLDLEEGRPGRAAEMERLFRSTRDRRGLVYAGLARAIRQWTRGRFPLAVREAQATLSEARALGMKFEALHARTIPGGGKPSGLIAAYRRLGAAPPKNAFAIP